MAHPVRFVGAKMALPQSQWTGLVVTALEVGLAAALTYASTHIGKEDFGEYTPMVVAVISLVISFLNKVINNPVVPTPGPVPSPTPLPFPNPVIPTPGPNNTTHDEHDFPVG